MRPIHLGEILRCCCSKYPRTPSWAIRVPATRVNDIVNSESGVTADTALRIVRYFGSSPDFWMNLRAAYDLRAAEREASIRIQREAFTARGCVTEGTWYGYQRKKRRLDLYTKT